MSCWWRNDVGQVVSWETEEIEKGGGNWRERREKKEKEGGGGGGGGGRGWQNMAAGSFIFELMNKGGLWSISNYSKGGGGLQNNNTQIIWIDQKLC
mgnify:CR=1 FL=1